MTQYQCGVDPSEENSGVTSSDEDTPEDVKEATDTKAETSIGTSVDTSEKILEENINIVKPSIETEVVIASITSTNTVSTRLIETV